MIVGKSCSGKTELSLLLKNRGMKHAVACTSRPIRPGEIDGIHYHFKSKEAFIKLLEDDALIEHDVFNGWYYGLEKEEFERSNILVVTPRGVTNLINKVGRDAITIIYLDTSPIQRLVRASFRGDKPNEMQRRFKADEEDFEDFHKREDWDVRIDCRIDDNYELLSKLFG